MELAKKYLADGKGFKSRMSRQKPVKLVHSDTKSDTKLGRGLIVADQALFLRVARSCQLHMVPSIHSGFESFIPFIRFAVNVSVSLFPRSSGARTE
jgi:hypothetical protein